MNKVMNIDKGQQTLIDYVKSKEPLSEDKIDFILSYNRETTLT